MKTKKIIIIITLLIVILMNSTIVLATINPDNYAPVVNTSGAGNAIALGKKIVGAINIIGTVIAVVVTMSLGIKYMMGSVEERAEYKKTMWPILVGMILLFGTTWIISLIYNIVPTDI